MRRVLFSLALALASANLCCQTPSPPQKEPLPPIPAPVPNKLPDKLPDAPQPRPTYHQKITVTVPSPPCSTVQPVGGATEEAPQKQPPQCTPAVNPYQRFLNSPEPLPLTPRQKGILAIHDVLDLANLFTITANAGFTVGLDSHTAYGPGWKGFGKNVGYGFSQDATGEFLSTFMLDSLLHQDPHYHRMPHASVPRRFVHAISHTIISQHDDGTPMPNYSVFITYPASAEIANLYVPGVATNLPSTAKRVAIGLASNPIDDLITEFLPDFARRVHVHVIFVQQIMDNLASGQPL